MVLTRETYLQGITKNFALLQFDIKLRKESNRQDLSILSEDFVKDLLNITFDFQLENLNLINSNMQGIDLGDTLNRIAVQVTSKSARNKVEETINTFIDYKFYEQYSKLYIFMLTEKQAKYKEFDTQGYFDFDWRKNILDFNSLLKIISHLKTEKLGQIHHFIEAEISSAAKSDKSDWKKHPDANYLALAVLIGAWDEKRKSDIEVVTQLLGIEYDIWLQKAREILQYSDSPLILKNGIWTVVNRSELWTLLGSCLFDRELETFKSIAVSVMKEPDPAFELPTDKRYAAGVYGKVLEHSYVLREAIAEGLAILGSQPDVCRNCSHGKAVEISVLAIREIFTSPDWILWGSLNNILSILSEAAPSEFIDAVERALNLTPCPFDQLFSQESNQITGKNYLTGLLWALEGLAWDEQYFVRVCLILGELASHDPGGQWVNRPANSLVTIFLPWLPQTLASVDKRKVAVQTLLKECPNIAWNLLIQLLPNKNKTSFTSHRPKWRKIIPDNWEKRVTHQEYQQQVSFYAELAISTAGYDTARLSELIDHFDNLPEFAFHQLIEVVRSKAISELPEDQQLLLWEHLTKFTNKHRKFPDAKWALPDEMLTRIEDVAEQLAPTDPFNRYQYLFTDRDFDLYDKNDNSSWEERQKKLCDRRDKAIQGVFEQNGVEGTIRFAETVISPDNVGYALGFIGEEVIEQTLLPQFLDSTNNKHQALMSGFIWRHYQISGWVWCDNIDKSEWTPRQIGYFLSCLPFMKETWDRASQWMGENQEEYWHRTGINIYQVDSDLVIAIDKLIEHGRPLSAINCLGRILRAKQPIDVAQCVRALLSVSSSGEPTHTMSSHNVVELIEFLQTEPSVAQEDLFRVEWAYLPLLNESTGVAPKYLESRLACNPEFFCEVIQLIYRSDKEDQPLKEPSENSEILATNAYRLLEDWKTPPGLQDDATFSAEHFNEWLQQVKTLCTKSGHLEVALINIGEVLIHAPSDPDGLWIHQTVASALNDRDAKDMRDGFKTGTYNSRGVYWVDPTSKPEKELTEQFRCKAEDLENAGFSRFAATFRELANWYEQEAKSIVDKYDTTNSLIPDHKDL